MAVPIDDLTAIFKDLGALEREFAEVELDALRRKEYSLRTLYTKREALFKKIPNFWPTVFGFGPEDIRRFFAPDDLPLLASIESVSVDRYEIQSETEGEPRSIRFTFHFAPNEFMENTTLIKEFEFHPSGDGPGNLISTPVPIKWKGKKKDPTRGLLDAAVQLYNAEEALKLKQGDKVVDIVDREALWQYEKLRETLVQFEEDEGDIHQPSFFSWFGFRGAVNAANVKKPAETETGSQNEEDDANEDELEELLDVEIFPAGDEVATALVEDLWPNAMDYFLSANSQDDESDDDDDEDEDDDEAPQLVLAEEDDDRPRKRARRG
ncbi:hypothetical protein Z517_06269 [Fonsecaea pedrosoi CBS 271.37]|uniref:Nucleosome assembly protein n=1 Tax=Fonsecaea pedrosoi CBS 271.37 TaxID=1442368 RepID=A0A0D2GM99_9EURO|nr:uncharacterized protein Z517_06269 [Fonsecaea pedrosoi CBS 271.37]KIW79655.1 hypothetical protein Z517_06269 [Fonsecaea pedrosoi CBS 271.37]